MRSVFRFLSYSLLYIIIAVASAYGVITISMSNYTRELNASNNSGGGSQEIVIPEEISSMFEKITSSPALGLELEVGVQAGETNIDILVDGEVDLSAGVDNLAVAADIVILLNGSPINLDLTYQNGNLYLEMLNNKFFIATDNLLSSVDQIMTLLNVEMPELGIDLDSLSLDTIMGFFANYEESVNEDGSLTLSVALPVGDNINLELITTSDYTLTGIGLEPISIEGTSIEAQGQLHYLVESSIPTLDSEDYIDLTNVIDLACGVINYVKQDNFALELNFKYQDVVLNGDILFSLNDKKALVKLNIEEYAVNLLYIDNNIYLEFNNIFVKFDLSQTNQLFELLSKYFDIDIPSQLISSIFGAIESGDFSEVIDSAGLTDFDLTQFDFSSIDLGILDSIVKDGNITTISIEEIGDILVTIDQGSLSQIAFDGFGVEADLSVIDYYEYSLSQNQGDYIDIGLLLPTINNVLGLLQNNTYSGVISAKIGDFNLDINYLLHRGESTFITLSTTLLGQDIKATIIDGKIYVEISDSKIVATLDNLGNVINQLVSTFSDSQAVDGNDESQLIDVDSILDSLLEIINPDVNPKLITKFTTTENGVAITLLDKYNITLSNFSNQLDVAFNYDSIDVKINVIGSEQNIVAPSFNDEEYTPIEDIANTIINVYNYVLDGKFYISLNASYKDLVVSGGINYDENGLSATITLTYKNLTANVIFYENSLYVTAENIKLVFNLNDIDYVKAFLNDYFGLDIESILQELLNGEQNSDVTEDGKTSESVEEASDNKLLDMLSGLLGEKSIEEIIAEAKLAITSDKISLTALDGLQVDILLSGNMIDQLAIKYQDISASASINKEPISIGVNASEYYNIIDLVDIVKGGVDLARQKQIGLSYNVTYNEIALSGNIYLDLESKSAKIVVNYKDITANVILIDNVLYLEAYNLYAKFGLSDIGNVTLLIEKYFGVDMPDELIAKLVSVIESGDLSQLLESIDTSSVDLSSIDLSVVEGIVKVEDKTIVSLADIGDITISMTEGKLNSVGFVGFDITANISTSTYQTISLYSPIESYIDIADLLPTLDNILAILQNNTFSGKINLIYGDYSFDVDYIIHTGDNSFVTLSTTIFGQSIVINIIENKVYIDISESKIVCDLDNIGNVIDKILAKFMPEQEAPSFDLKEELDKLLDVNNNPLLITSFVKSENGISLAILDKIFVSLGNGDKSLTIDANYQNIDISASLKASEETLARPEIVGHYTQIENIVDTVINVYDYVASKTFYVSFNASYQDIALVGGVNYDESGLSATVTLTYKNLTANIIHYQNSLYITAENIKLVFDLDDIDYVKAFLNDYFGLDIESMLQELLSGEQNSDVTEDGKTSESVEEASDNKLLDMLSGLLGGKSIEEIVTGASFKITDNIISLTALDGLKIDISLENNMISTAYIEYILQRESDNSATESEPASQSKIVLNATIEDSPLVFNPVGEFTDVAGILNYVELFMQYVETKKLELGVDLNIDDDNITGALQLDLTSTLMMSASLTSNTIENFDININIEKDETGKQMLYVDYSGLCLKIDNSNFNEILYILLEVLGIDTTKIPFLSEIDLDLDFSQIDTDIASIDLSIEDIINMLKMVKSIKEENNALVITLDGGAIFGNESAEDLVISLHKEGGKINKLVIANCYLNSELSSKIGATITFNEITEFKHVDTSKNYIDISGSNELIKAIVNMSNDTDFHVHGSLNVVGNLAGIEIKWNVPFDIYIKAVAKGKVEIYGVIGEIPTMVGVNNDVPCKFDDTNSGSNRYLYFYYQDDYIYLYRSETIGQFFGSGRTYEKCTKVSVDTFFGDIMYYVQYCFGFTDTIMNAIIESMNNPRTEPMDMSNIITSFVVQDNTNFAVELNMHELTNNPDLDKLSLTLGLRQDSEGKNYIGGMTVALNMPLADIFTLYLTSDDITLVDYGKEVDMSPLYDFINNYKYPNESEWEASDGEWNMVSETLYTINFESNSEQTLSSQTYHYKDALNLPVLSDYVVDDGKTNTYYHFVSWHTSEDLSDESVFNSTTMPRGDITLYAKWTTNTTTYYTIDFVTNSDQSVNPITKLEGEEITLPSFTTKEETDENTTSYYEFGGWYTTSNFDEGSEFTESVMPSKNVTLYAKWNLVKTAYTRSLNIYDGDQLLTTLRVKAGDVIDFSTLSNVSDTTKFYYEKEFKNQMVDFTMPDNDLNIYIRNMYKVTFTSLYGNTSTVTYSLYQGESITELPAQSSYVYDDGTQTVQTTYTFNGYNVTTNVMPNHDITFEADWTVTEKQYYTITFDILDNDVSLHISPWKGNAKLYYNGVETSTMSYCFLEGQVDLNAFVARCKYRAVLYYYYIFQGWKGADENGYYNLTGDVTIEASFSSLQSGKDGYDQN